MVFPGSDGGSGKGGGGEKERERWDLGSGEGGVRGGSFTMQAVCLTTLILRTLA